MPLVAFSDCSLSPARLGLGVYPKRALEPVTQPNGASHGARLGPGPQLEGVAECNKK